MDKQKAIFLGILLFGVLLVICLIFFIISFLQGSTTQAPALPSPTPVGLIVPSSGTVLSPSPTQLQLLSVDPQEDTTGINNYSPAKHVTFTFNKELHPEKLQIETSPQEELKVTFGETPKEVIVIPTFGWDADVLYVITIKKGAIGLDGALLQNDIVYRIKTTTTQGGV